jgi:hypothetical protein
MLNNQRLYSFTLQNILVPRLPHPYPLRVQSILRPVDLTALSRIHARLVNEKISATRYTGGWSGASGEDHAINRVKKRDVTDPEVKSTAEGQQERTENEGIANGTKSQATTERNLGGSDERTKEEHPAAPEPVIGMNDERGKVSQVSSDTYLRLSRSSVTGSLQSTCLIIHYGSFFSLSYRKVFDKFPSITR